MCKSRDADHQKLIDEVKEAPVTGLPTDAMVQIFNIDNKYQMKRTRQIGSRIQRRSWKKGYKDHFESFTKDTRMFQAEVAVIHHCARKIGKWTELGKGVVIFSDNQATLTAIISARVYSKLVSD